jgi:branched-chain amino acid transport system substrate-binding protein
MKTVRLLSMAAIVAMLFAVFGAGSTQQIAAQGKVIKIASQSPLSGSQSLDGTGMKNAADLAIAQLAKPITDMGYTVQFVPYDDQATADVGVSNAHKIVDDAAILAVIGHFNSGVALPSSVVYNDNNLVMISPANTNPLITDRALPTVNRVCGRDDNQGRVGADYASNVLKAKTVYIIHDQSVYGQGVAQVFNDIATANGIQVLGFEGTTEKSNFDAVLTPIAAQTPDVIYFGGSDVAQIAAFWKQARDKGIKAQFMGPDGMDSPDIAKNAGDAAVGLVYTTTAGPASLFTDAKQFVTDYKAKYGVDVTPYAPEAYAATQIALNAIETVLKANGGAMPTRKDVAAAVRATKDFPTVVGPITFDANGDRTTATYYILKVGSADPAKWSSNELISKSDEPSPLFAKSMMSGTMAATMAATSAQ